MIRWILNYGNNCQEEKKDNEAEAKLRYETDFKYWKMYYDGTGDKIPREWLEKYKLV